MATFLKLFTEYSLIFKLLPWYLTKLLVRFLIGRFDANRALYCTVVFPIYQIISVFLIILGETLYLNMDAPSWMYLALFLLVIIVGLPIALTWHLSCLLLTKAFFEYMYVHKQPSLSIATDLINATIDGFRHVARPVDQSSGSSDVT